MTPRKETFWGRVTGRVGRRLPVQLLALGALNSYYPARFGKTFCLPVLNCYACPVGATACPIGTVSAFAMIKRFPFYVLGLLGLAGVAVGRAFCGWACPFGLLQDALYRIPSPKRRLPKAFNGLKYVLLAALVIALPLFFGQEEQQGAADRIATGATASKDFCALVCPAGTLQGGVPRLITDAELRARMDWHTWRKLGMLVAVLVLAVLFRRSFCRAVCPLGALMALATPVSLLRLRTDPSLCTRCGRCRQVCPMDCRSVPDAEGGKEASAECILCLDCVRNCPVSGALEARWAGAVASASRKGGSDA